MKLVQVSITALALMVGGLGTAWSNDNTAPVSSGSGPLIAPSSEATVAGNVARNLVHVSAATVRYDVGGGLVEAGQYRVETTPTTTTVTCPAGASCVITATITVQLAGDQPNNRAWFCFLIDNVQVAPVCPYVGLVFPNYQAFSFPFAK